MDILKRLQSDKSKAKGAAKAMPEGKADYPLGDRLSFKKPKSN